MSVYSPPGVQVDMEAEPIVWAMRVEAWLRRAARRRPGRAAVNALTYAALDEAASAGARDLHARGGRPGGRVAVALAPREGLALALHPVLRLGPTPVPVRPP